MSTTIKPLLTAAGTALALFAVASTQAAEPVRWKMPTAFVTEWPGLGDTAVYVSKALDESTGGNIQLKVYEPGKLVPAFQILDAVKDKKVEAGFTWLGYDQGKVPSAPLFAAVPFGLEPWEFATWWYDGEGEKLGQEVYGAHGVHLELCGIIGPEAAGWFRREIKNAGDVKGLKIRFAGIGGKVMQKMGASVTVLPGAEIFPALEKGAIDATEFSMPAIDEKIGFQKLIKNYYFPGWHQPSTAMHLMVNKGVWDALDKTNKAMIHTACTAATLRGLTRGEYAQLASLKTITSSGVQLRSLNEKTLRDLEKATNEVLAEEAAKDAPFKKVYESQRAFEKNYKQWKDKAYLPRSW